MLFIFSKLFYIELTLNIVIMKIKYLISLLLVLLTVVSCKPIYQDTFYIENLSGRNVVCRLEYNVASGVTCNSNAISVGTEKQEFFSMDIVSTSSCFDHNSNFILGDNSNVNFKIIFIFDDEVSISYDKSSTFSNNPCLTRNWNVFREIDKRYNKQHHAVYTITEEDYQNAISRK